MTEHPYRIAVIDDHPLLRIGLAAELERAGFGVDTPELAATDQLIDWVGRRSFSCVVVDLGLPIEGGGLALIEPVVATSTAVAVLTGETDCSLLASCFDAGAVVVLTKSEPLPDIVEAIGLVCAGNQARTEQRLALLADRRRLRQAQEDRLAPFTVLSRREREVLAGLMDGRGPAELAERDFVSIQTVRTQVKSVLRKLGVRSQLEAVARASASGWEHRPEGQSEVGQA